MPAVNALVAELEATGVPVRFFNENAASDERRAAILDAVAECVGSDGVGVLVHSLAFGTLRPFVPAPDSGGKAVARRQIDMTLDVMANSLVYWVQDLVERGLLGHGGRVFAMTSSGSQRVFASYGPVSAAKAALESHVRQLAHELLPRGITVNAIMAGVTDTPALRKIPGAERIKQLASERNPGGRLTTPEDVAACMLELSRAGTYWMTGNTIRVDGGEDFCA
jgi:NAD(P)-dependent dehydrogenase (short-subunit alcohol dehydrogenase family)